MLRRFLQAATLSLSLAAAVNAQPLPDYGFDWVTVGDPGNANATQAEFIRLPRDAGAVDYSFRITDLPVTLEQWIDFGNAFDQFASPQERLWLVGGSGYTYRDPASGRLAVGDGFERFGAVSNFMLAARFCNWLHNGRVNEAWAFDDGAYDMSRFTQDAEGRWQNTGARRPDAAYWIPTLDEQVKASYYDPHRDGPGRGGYWLYPHGDDDPPVYGAPWDPGAQSSAGIDLPVGGWYFDIPLGLYPDAKSPYGLLDVSGGVNEWADTPRPDFGDPRQHYIQWSSAGIGAGADFRDQLGNIFSIGRGLSGLAGFRIATVVPAPMSALPMIGLLLWRRTR